MDYAKRRDAAYAAFSPDGTPLFENPDEELPALKAQEEKAQRVSSKREARQMRKRWGAPGKEEHKYSTALFKISPRKLKLLADQIGGQPIDHAILQMQFSAKRAAKRIKSTLALARDHAAAKGLDPRSLIVSEAWIGKGKYITRADLKGRARVGRKHHPFARMSIVLRPGKTWQQKELEKLEKARKRMRSIGDGGVVRTNKKIVNMFQRPGWAW
ncbi:ribosomal protein L22 [Violaceomyces palustris]|uniref:Ribosomal protein L22 n=1 Tax=Violaceomyces palustris TaxID=1673888 RepID=A0ACD0NPW1_9BASI|nr:ribosomal protein L22 [Violaceomyces palustris]